MALSHPFASVEEMQVYVPYAKSLCQRYGIIAYEERELLITDLFPYSMNKGKCNIIFVKEEAVWHTYEQLKQTKQRLIKEGKYQGRKRKELALSFGALLSYSEAACLAKITYNQEKE